MLAKLKTPGVLEEERPLLRKQQREARQVDLARVDLCLAEVRVDGAGQLQAGRDVVEEIEARACRLTVVVRRCAEMQPAARHERPDVEADALRQPLEIRDLARLRHLEELRLEARAGPAGVLELSIDVAGDVEAPHRLRRRESSGS